MKIESQPLEGHQVQLTVEIEPSLLEDAKIRAAKKIARKVKIPGFRPGKAPYQVVLRYASEEAVAEEAIELLVDEVYPKVIEESGVEPYGPGKLKDIKSMDPPIFEFVVPLKASVELGDYLSVRFPYELQPVAPSQVDDVLANLQERQAVIEIVDRLAGEGDLVMVTINGHQMDTEEHKPVVENRTVTIDIKAEDADASGEWPFPGLSRKLIGLKAGDEQSYDFDFAEDYTYESLRGITAHFDIVVKEVKSRTLPELTDEFAQSVGEYPTLEDLRAAILSDLETHALEECNNAFDEKVMDGIIELSTIKYPDEMLKNEVEDVIEHLKSRLERQGMDLELYLKTRSIDMDALRTETTPVAEKRLKRTLSLLELAEKEGIKISPEDLQAETTRTLEQFSRVMPEKDFKKLIAGDASTSNLVSNIMMDMVIGRTQERIRLLAQGITPQPPEESAPEDQVVVDIQPADDAALESQSAEEPAVENPPVEPAIDIAAEAEAATQPPAETE